MENPTPSLREQGIQALRERSLDTAVDLLARAVMADPQDAEAQAFLGVAYSQKGVHAQAKRALEAAVALQPQNARYRFNLGVALEQAGDVAGAANAYDEALQLDPQHAQARARAQALAATAAAPVPVAPQAAPASAPSLSDAPWLRGREGSPAAQSGSLGAASAGPAGTVQCPHCHQWSKPGLSCEWCSAPLRSAPASAAAPWLQGTSGGAPGTAAAMGPAVYVSPEMGSVEAFGRRFAAVFIDGIVVGMVNFVAGLLLGGAGRSGGAGSVAAILVSLVIYVGYYAGMLTARGATLGKFALGLRVIGPEGGNPSFWRATLRETIGKFISGLVFSLGYLWMLWDEGQQTWHDKLAGTYVERA